MSYPKKLETLDDLIRRLKPDARFDHIGIQGASSVVRMVDTRLAIPYSVLPDCLLLVRDGGKLFTMASQVSALICQRTPDQAPVDRIPTLFHLTERNIPTLLQHLASAQPSNETANMCGRMLLTTLTDPKLPPEFLTRPDKLNCYGLIAQAVDSPTLRAEAAIDDGRDCGCRSLAGTNQTIREV